MEPYQSDDSETARTDRYLTERYQDNDRHTDRQTDRQTDRYLKRPVSVLKSLL